MLTLKHKNNDVIYNIIMSGIINYISSWFKSDKPKDDVNNLTVKGIQQEAKKIIIDDIKPFNYDESSELDLNQIIFVDSMKSDINDLTLNTLTSSSLNMSPNQELTNSSEINKQSISDKELISDKETSDKDINDNKEIKDDNIKDNQQIKLQINQPQIISDVSETEKMIDRIMKNATTETMKGGNYRTKYNKNNYIMNGGSNEYCGKVNKQIYDSHKVDIGGY